jgi:hypothetical protein
MKGVGLISAAEESEISKRWGIKARVEIIQKAYENWDYSSP